MLIPSPAHIQWRKIATASARQLNTNNAATAPTWKRPKAMLLVQFIFRRSATSVRSVLTGAPGILALGEFYHAEASLRRACSADVFVACKLTNCLQKCGY